MELTIIRLPVAWIGLSTFIAGRMARNFLSRAVNVALITLIGYLLVLYVVFPPLVPRNASALSLLCPIVLAGAAAAVVVAGLGYVRIGQVRRQSGSR